MTESASAVTAPSVPLGATWDGRGVDFRVFSRHAERVTLCLFESPGSAAETRRVELARRDGAGVWHVRLEDAAPGQLYGYRVDGPWAPRRGLLHNPSKLLIDPWSRAVTGEPEPDSSLFAIPYGGPIDGGYDGSDSAGAMPKCVVVDPSFDWQGVERPRIPWRDTVIYEAHVAGMTRLREDVPEELRGTYLGLASEPVLEHLRSIGVTSIELLPIHQAAPEAHLLEMGKRNYWGYAPVSFFAPSAAYATAADGRQVGEFQAMVRELHRAGFEVLVDVVFNHTAEGGLSGPIYGPKGFDARAFYRFAHRRFTDFTGTGNTLDIRSPLVLHTVLESLRYFVGTLGVDGFRFDLAPVVGRTGRGFDPGAPLFEAIAEDPLLSTCKWIAEPWDLGPGGYQVGGFPAPWTEWNDRFRDTVRRFWRGEASGPLCADLATRLAGSQDLFDGRAPLASVNYVTAHDGFTLRDLVSFERKHNEANGEENRDGRDENLSRNWGVEGPSDDDKVRSRRRRIRRGLLATLLLAQGVPMLGHGDELGRTQRGNNNAYCQDNEISWIDWSSAEADLVAFVGRVTELRRHYPQLRREHFLEDGDVLWLSADAQPLGEDDWKSGGLKTFCVRLPGEDGADDLLLVLNGADHRVDVRLPEGRWRRLLESATGATDEAPLEDAVIHCPGFSLQVLARRP